MNEGISVIILISHKIDVWHSKLHARFVFGTNWEDINNAVDYLKACEMINENFHVRYFPVQDRNVDYPFYHMWEEGMSEEELKEYLDE
ncbi:hypothetical protein KNT70_gp057 [Cronobacter phage Pet-CM3-4]|uniref:Uncharacterized protein n=1 Tax=Cronobacter phage Pet-CM3-4 TaxID=1892569 RepID=A0A1D3RKE7_9CAUD|nr:hypothetical protein KNT70_gp057 [Cronobacter phage Pet-CM3-4]SCN45750.1 hypothetical protein [Cronobacter phage Pet-CM3-4]